MDIYNLMNQRFSSTPIPKPTIEVTKDNEKLTQWLIEHALFRDFIYRNPEREKGKEYCDALIIYDDTIIIIQNKTQVSSRNPIDWAKNNINHALKQLNGSYRMLMDGIVTKFYNEFICVDVSIDIKKQKNIYGMIVLAQKNSKYEPLSLIEKDNHPIFPFNIFSLDDLFIVNNKMDTAGDLITYLELRYEAHKKGFLPLINDEENNMQKLCDYIQPILMDYYSDKDKLILEKAVQQRVYFLKNNIKDREDYQYSTLFDDIIAKAHDIDETLFDKGDDIKKNALRISEILGYVTRDRRIEIGKKLYNSAQKAQQTACSIFVHIQKPINQVYLYIFTKENRTSRQKYLQAMVVLAQIKYNYKKVLGVATEPLGTGGRSYDFALLEEEYIKNGIEIPNDISDQLPDPNHNLI